MKREALRLFLAPALVLGLAIGQMAITQSASAAANCIKGDRKPPYTIGWANIYSVPTWMKQTEGHDRQGGRGAEGEGPGRQARHHRCAGQRQHPDPADPVDDRRRYRRHRAHRRLGHRARPRRRRCLRQGHRRRQFRQPRHHRQGDRQGQHRFRAWGTQAAEWLVGQMGGKGKIIVLNGPAGISVSDDRRKGADPVLAANPGRRDPRRDEHRLQCRPGAGSRDQPPFQPSRDRRHPVARRRAVRRRDPRHGSAGPRARPDDRRELPASSSSSGRRRD